MVVVVTGVLALSGCGREFARQGGGQRRVAHNVYFELHDATPEACERLVKECYTYLAGEKGIVFFAAGPLVDELDREVNVRDWHVGLHVVFANMAHHDRYQDAAAHHTFIERNKANWKNVRVFDSFVK
ncbi:MAG: Dabb family protein [Phycisphaerae bacterium]|nr:Dabb family protein [Phycisphaerae bacterium]